MSKTFTYKKITGRYYLDYTDEWEEDEIDFDYEVEDRDLLPEVINLIYNEFFDGSINEDFIKGNIRKMINENDLLELFIERYEDVLSEIFEKEAMEWYES